MDDVVTSRVPSEIRKQANAILKEIGATQTQLVNAAYAYLLEHRSLPSAGLPAQTKPGRRILTPEVRKELTEFFAATTQPVPESYWEGKTYDQLLEEGRGADYAALA